MTTSSSGQLRLPVARYEVSDDYWKFGDRVPRRFGLWAVHLGDDVVVPAGTGVSAIGDGEVVLARTFRGSERKRSWGGTVVLRHDGTQKSKVKSQNFYSIYGHLRDLTVRVGDRVAAGQELGRVAGSYTPENGWWKTPHLHFAIYTGSWRGVMVPGYWRPERFWRTRRKWWHDPRSFIGSINDREDTSLR